MAMLNAWITHTTLSKDETLNLKEFQRAVTTVYLNKTMIKTRDRPRILAVPSYSKENIRKDSVDHFLVKREKQRCYQREGCKRKPKSYRGK
ncbi:hypothetical protein TNCV_4228461 [Trichonephila clavipes]|nr:hypothetical protein TNCV_4228461 [Trichonephila clavipes]